MTNTDLETNRKAESPRSWEHDVASFGKYGPWADESTTERRPLITFLVPCYNSADYLHTCVDSLLAAKDDAEIIIVNDGSTDSTLEVANAYAQKHRNIIVINQENSGWGGGVNRGLAIAKGIYFKVVDSDDWLDADALAKVIETMHGFAKSGQWADLLITNYVYDHIEDKSQHVTEYRKLMPSGRMFRWSEVGKPVIGQYIMIHASWYRTSLLRKSELRLPTGVCYMDSMFILHPMPYVKRLFYLDVDAYHYLIGRADQSVNIEVLKKHIDQQLLATRLAIDDYDFAEMKRIDPKMAETMMYYINCMVSVSNTYLYMINTPESIAKNKQMWAYIKKRNPELYHDVRKTIAGLCNRKTPFGRFLVRRIYTITKHIFKFA